MSSNDKNNELNRIKDAENYASKYNLQVHAGHGLNLSNLPEICKISTIE